MGLQSQRGENMGIDVLTEDNTCTIRPKGWIDSSNAAELDGVVVKQASLFEKMVLDFAEVEYISSAGLRVIVNAHRAMEKKQGLLIKNMNSSVFDIIKLTGFDKKLNIEK